jgi:hypothetical protein
MPKLLIVAGIVFLINLPFGYWRAGTRRFSTPWFLAIHLPVPLIIVLRFSTGLGWHWTTFPALVGAFFAGQLAGGGLRHAVRRDR